MRKSTVASADIHDAREEIQIDVFPYQPAYQHKAIMVIIDHDKIAPSDTLAIETTLRRIAEVIRCKQAAE